ncbi:hypothetical protein FVR03_21385 [Pontibacter qinzhouensis]|uniref:Uncharacterized protein n=1 Tax=Pontibacter qinzhouensis TaxID=2603253 RepID=A0A5C8J065_9BACT|nr:hypothetical protein [Pontibacter qinzhouensis]TXK26983.1 hypothetical protein FVR03_21385 [Pontibacter qinzhouensis]
MRQNREEHRGNFNDWRQNEEPRQLHEQRHGNNSDRGNYTTDSHFHPGTGRAFDKDFYDQRTFNSNADHQFSYPQGRYQAGGATYSGPDYGRDQRAHDDNPYGMTYRRNDGYNSGRHYDARADYSNTDYDDRNHPGRSNERTGMEDERFGHEVRRGGGNDRFLGHSSPGDYESYRRYEQDNRMYDNDYSGGFAGRNHTAGREHFGEDSSYSSMDSWNDKNNQRHNRHEQGQQNRRR